MGKLTEVLPTPEGWEQYHEMDLDDEEVEDFDKQAAIVRLSLVRLERDQAVSVLQLIIACRTNNDLVGLLDSIDAASALLTRLEDK